MPKKIQSSFAMLAAYAALHGCRSIEIMHAVLPALCRVIDATARIRHKQAAVTLSRRALVYSGISPYLQDVVGDQYRFDTDLVIRSANGRIQFVL